VLKLIEKRIPKVFNELMQNAEYLKKPLIHQRGLKQKTYPVSAWTPENRMGKNRRARKESLKKGGNFNREDRKKTTRTALMRLYYGIKNKRRIKNSII
jgi:hypothetical protein